MNGGCGWKLAGFLAARGARGAHLQPSTHPTHKPTALRGLTGQVAGAQRGLCCRCPPDGLHLL